MGSEMCIRDSIKPKPRIPIPVLVGGRSDAALTRAAKFSEGWIGVWCSAKRFADAVDIVRDEAQAEGRSQVDWCHGYQPWVGVDLKSSKKAFDAVKQGMERFYHIPFEKFERYTPSGTPAEVAEQLAPYVKAGCRLFNLKICAEHPEEEVALGAEVIEHLRQYAPAKVA